MRALGAVTRLPKAPTRGPVAFPSFLPQMTPCSALRKRPRWRWDTALRLRPQALEHKFPGRDPKSAVTYSLRLDFLEGKMHKLAVITYNG